MVTFFLKGSPDVAKLEQEDIYLDPPNLAFFHVEKPNGGFRFVEHGEAVPFEELAAFRLPGMKLIGSIKRHPFTALSRDKGENGILFLPTGNTLLGYWLNFFEGEKNYKGKNPKLTPIFEVFRKLKSEEEILNFASKYGELRPKGEEKYTLSLPENKVWLESLSLWKKEISAVNNVIDLWESDAADRDLSELLNRKLRKYPSIQEYGIDKKGNAFPVFRSHSLGAAIWLQLAQSVFRDGPNERIARRCFFSGEYLAQQCLIKKTTGEYAGMYYHLREKRKFYRQNNTIEKSYIEGSEEMKERKNKSKFLVPFPADIQRQKNNAP